MSELTVTAGEQCVSVAKIKDNVSHGCASMSRTEDGWYVNRVLVRPEYRRQGLGTKMVKALLDNAAGLKVIVEPGGYNMKHKDQVAFYESCGFKKADNCWEYQ